MTGLIEQIYRQHRKGLFTLALSITGRVDSAEDAVHDAMLRLCKSARPPTGDPVAYVFAAVRNAALDQRRRKGSVSIFDMPEPTQPAGDIVMEQDMNRLIARALDELPAEQREAVVMHLYTGLTFQQSAQALDVPLQTIASRYRRALTKLRETLASLR